MLDASLRAVVRVDQQGRLLVPKELREAVGMRPGENVTLLVDDGQIRVVTVAAVERFLREMRAKYNPAGTSMVDELIAERRAEAAHE